MTPTERANLLAGIRGAIEFAEERARHAEALGICDRIQAARANMRFDSATEMAPVERLGPTKVAA